MKFSTVSVAELLKTGEAEVKTGPFGTQLKASDYVSEGTPVINVRNIGFGNIREDKLEYIGKETVQRLASHLLKPEDIVFGRKGAVERHVFIQQGQSNWFQGSDCLRLRLSSNRLFPRFASYFLLTHEHQQWMMSQCSHGATMASLNQDIISRIQLPCPPLAAQRRIASFLSAYDDLIVNNTRRIAILEEMARQIYEEWFVRFRFPGHQQVKMVESDLGLIPEAWCLRAFDEVASFVNGYAFKPDDWGTSGLPIIKIKELKAGIQADTPRYSDILQKKYRISNGALLFSWSADLDVYIWAGGDGWLNQHLFVVNALGEETPKSWLYHALKESMPNFRSRSNGATMKHIKRSALSEVKVLLPTEILMNQFATAVQPMHSLVISLRQKNQNLRATRDLLLPKLISGELDVSTLPEPEEALAA